MDYAAALLDENRAFGELIRAGDPAVPIPTCPEWNLNQLFRHVGRGHLWAAQIVAERLDHPLDPRTVEGGKPPADPDDATTWLHDGAQRVIDAVAQAGADTPVWTFLGPRPAAWWIRRRLHELTVHRADAALALGVSYRLAPELAADGISEWFDVAVSQAGRDGAAPPLRDGETIHLHATDPGLDAAGEWTIAAGPDGISWSHEHGKGSVALRGSATELFLATLRRIPITDTGVTVFGDTAVWQRWLDQTPF
ncbi:MAG TPA: maleylpyruvate isomerase family mycothiol-dependent enzyme [Mycobacterium sp.]|nr:maleylpyruvate isomerase family mycothiol-dependent enzyme [Mycobacterium sp.]